MSIMLSLSILLPLSPSPVVFTCVCDWLSRRSRDFYLISREYFRMEDREVEPRTHGISALKSRLGIRTLGRNVIISCLVNYRSYIKTFVIFICALKKLKPLYFIFHRWTTIFLQRFIYYILVLKNNNHRDFKLSLLHFYF